MLANSNDQNSTRLNIVCKLCLHRQDGNDIMSAAWVDHFFLTQSSIKELESDEAAKITQRQGNISIIVKVLRRNFAFVSKTAQPSFCYDETFFFFFEQEDFQLN